MALTRVVRFKLKSDPDYTEVPLDGDAISAGQLKEVITQKKLGGSSGAFGLRISNVQTGEGDIRRTNNTCMNGSLLSESVPRVLCLRIQRRSHGAR